MRTRYRLGFFFLVLPASACSKGDSTTAATDAGPDATVGSRDSGAVVDASALDGGGGLDGGMDGADASSTDGAPQPDGSTPPRGPSVTQFHKNDTRDGMYIEPSFTKAAAANMHHDTTFTAAIQGPVYAQPLYVENGVSGKDTLYVATELATVYAIDAVSGAIVWRRNYGTPVPLAKIGAPDGDGGFNVCHYIDPTGITGTPVIDLASRTMYFDSLTTPDDGTTQRQKIFAVSLDDGSVRAGWPIDLESQVSQGGVAFVSAHQNQRPALAIFQGSIYVAYGGFAGDCPTPYYGWLVSAPLAAPSQVKGWRSSAAGAPMWGPGGPSSDGTYLYEATGNQDNMNVWTQGEAVLRFSAGPTWAGTSADYFTPSNHAFLDEQDLDLGGTAPVIFDIPNAPKPKLLLQFGKSGIGHLLDRSNLGGTGTGNGTVGEGLVSALLASGEIRTAPAVYRTAAGTFAAIKAVGSTCPAGSTILSVKVGVAPYSLTTAWCGDEGGGEGSPIVTTSDGHQDAIVWAVGAEGDTRLHGFDGETGAVIFNGGLDTFSPTARYQTPIVAKGRVFWATNQEVIAFTIK